MAKDEKIAHIHLKITKALKRSWKQEFKRRGHNTMKSGIVAAVFNYLNLQGAEPRAQELATSIEAFVETLQTIDERLAERLSKVETLDYEMPTVEEIEEAEDMRYEVMKRQLIEKIKRYEPISITFLSSTLKIKGERLMPFLKRMKEEHLIKLNPQYEWELDEAS